MVRILIFVRKILLKLHTYVYRYDFGNLGKNSSIAYPLRFANLNNIYIGDRSTIHSNCWLQTIERDQNQYGVINIGDYVSLGMDSTVSAALKITIEDYVLTARNVYISDHRHAYENIKEPIRNQGNTEFKEVVIGRGTWLSQNVVILPGVTIGKNCVIGANSLLNSDIPDYCIAAGNPAKVLKQYNLDTGKWVKP